VITEEFTTRLKAGRFIRALVPGMKADDLSAALDTAVRSESWTSADMRLRVQFFEGKYIVTYG
jgi:hypothetical protein